MSPAMSPRDQLDRLCRFLDQYGPPDNGEGGEDDESDDWLFGSPWGNFRSARRPDWTHWFDAERWDLVNEAIPLLLDDEPSVVRPPYLYARWWRSKEARHHRPQLVRRLLLIIETADAGKLGKAGRQIGWHVAPLDFVAWVAKQVSIDLPLEMHRTAAEKLRRMHRDPFARIEPAPGSAPTDATPTDAVQQRGRKRKHSLDEVEAWTVPRWISGEIGPDMKSITAAIAEEFGVRRGTADHWRLELGVKEGVTPGEQVRATGK